MTNDERNPNSEIRLNRIGRRPELGLGIWSFFGRCMSVLGIWAWFCTLELGASAGPASTNLTSSSNSLPTLQVNQAIMVTVELDFGPHVPTIAEALRDVERRHQPDDQNGRVFAILDAYGEPTADGKKLHISMHVSTEKPGVGTLVFRRTGETLWQSRIVASTNANSFSGKNLTILLDDGTGKTQMVDGSGGPASILDARLRDSATKVRDIWPDGTEREVTFIYSACGCPVKVAVRRVAERTERTKELPVMFPDDPLAMQFIEPLMGWRVQR